MFPRIYRYLPIILTILFIEGCTTSKIMKMNTKNDNKVDFKISVGKEIGVRLNN